MKYLTTDQLNHFFERNHTNTDIEVARGYPQRTSYKMKADYIDIVTMNRDERMGVVAIGLVYGVAGSTIHKMFAKLKVMRLYEYINAPQVYSNTSLSKDKVRAIELRKEALAEESNFCVIDMAVNRNKGNIAAGAWL